MKVLFITHCVVMGGGNFSLLQLMKELKQSPYNVEPVLLAPLDTPADQSSILREAKAAGIECVSMRFYQFKWSPKSASNYIRYFSNAICYPQILAKVKKINPDLIHTNSSIISIGGWLSSKLNIPHIWHLREFGDLDFNMQPLFGISQESKLYKRSNKFIAISKAVKNRFLPFIPNEKIEVVYNGLPRMSKTIQVSEKQASQIVNFCISGNLNPAKRQMDALRALDILINKDGITNLHIYILGEGIERESLMDFCKEKGLESYVTFTGWVKNVDSYYSKCQVGLMLSTNEGFGRVTIDYMRSGMAVIASEGGANPELIKNEETGMLFKTGDIKALAEKMRLMITHPAVRMELAEKAYEFSRTHFISEENTKAIFEIYQSVI